MAYKYTNRRTRVLALCGCAALFAPFAASTSAFADDTAAVGVKDIVVTAQKRSQRMQDVPISMTALSASSLEANRITSVTDLSAAVPNMAARLVAGGASLPAFTMRGVTSYGVVPGSDKELSIYIDGVYIGSSTGSALDLPDVAQIEVLRGPQGTLFGRNSTVGAISVTTRDPASKFGLGQEFTYGNYDEFRSKTRVDFGSFGDFSASVSYLHDQRKGDITNSGAGQIWHFPASAGVPTTQVSPATLGDKDVDTIFAAIKYEPNSSIKIVNKFDYTTNHYTPAGVAAVASDSAFLGMAYGGYLQAVLDDQPGGHGYQYYNPNGAHRPSSVNNNFSLPAFNKDWGDSLTGDFRISDHLALKSITAYRESYVRASDQIDGFGGLVMTSSMITDPRFTGIISPAALAYLVGSPFVGIGIEQVTTSSQFSQELQANYNSKLLTLTAGLMYFHLDTRSGGPTGLPFNVQFSPVPGGDLSSQAATAGSSYYTNHEDSAAAYTQAEFHVTSQLDAVGGLRLTHDIKSGEYISGVGSSNVLTNSPYNNTQVTYSLGLNYKPTRDIMIYGKYSTAFVSGGQNYTQVYKPEKAKSWEAGIKSEWFDRKVRANLALFDVTYTDVQSAQSGITIGLPLIGLAVDDQGGVKAKGFEFDTTIVPVQGVTLGAAAGYTDTKYTSVNPNLGAALGYQQPGGPVTPLGYLSTSTFLPTLMPKWTADFSGQYETPPVFDGANLTFRIDASWHDKEDANSYTLLHTIPQYASIVDVPASWNVNTRISLDHVKLPYGELQLAFWVKNLTNSDEVSFPEALGGSLGGTEYVPARTYGLDVNFKM